jgi:hypothetical protein
MLFCVVARSLLGLPGSAGLEYKSGGTRVRTSYLLYVHILVGTCMVLEYSSTTMVLSTASQRVEALIVQHITNPSSSCKS